MRDHLQPAIQEEIDLSAGAQHAGLLVVFSLGFCVHFEYLRGLGTSLNSFKSTSL